VDGITELLNITYDAVDISQTYDQILDIKVTATGAPPPTTVAPKPYATPRDFSPDITTWLAPNANSEAGISKARMFNNIEIPGAALGTVIAAQSYTAPDYAFNWVRDSSLTMDVVNTFYASATTASVKPVYSKILFDYASARATEQNDPDLQTGLGEPKFYLNNSVFTGPWGRPQNDGPATAAITLVNFANAYLSNGGSMDTVKSKIYDSTHYPQAPVMKDLAFVASNWSYPSFDIWEEEPSDHFYTRLVQRRALVMGADFATKMGDSAFASTLSAQASALSTTLSQFWDPRRDLILYEYGPVLRGKGSYKDVAVVLGVLHGYANDGVYSYTNDEVLASAYQIATSFIDVFPIANVTEDASGQVLGIPVGRYPEDVYDGVGTSLGNPWYLCTAAVAELFYKAANQYITLDQQIIVTQASLPFWQYFAPQERYHVGHVYKSHDHHFAQMTLSLKGWGDAFMRRIKYHTPSDGHLTEEFGRASGLPVGATDLTWSYAALLTAAIARANLDDEGSYLTDLANIAVPANS